MPAFMDLTGHKYGRLTVLDRSKNISKIVAWRCLCSCGTKTIVKALCLRSGGTKSCGCLGREIRKLSKTTHGMVGSAEYTTWCALKSRCNTKTDKRFHDYGGRGIKVCDGWLKFEGFYADMGDKPSPNHSIDRIDNDGNYEPGNCRWATTEQQSRNKRIRKDNKTGIAGIEVSHSGNYYVRFYLSGKKIVLYSGKDFFEACCVRKSAELRYWN